MNSFIYNHHMSDAAPPCNQVWDVDTSKGDTTDDRRFSLGIETFPGRILGATEPGDIIQLHASLAPEWPHIVAHYKTIGLSHTSVVVWDDRYEIAARFPRHTLSPFFFGEGAHAVRMDKRWLTIARAMNSKNECMRVCAELGIPTPRTLCFKSKHEAIPYESLTFPLYLKADESVSGRGVLYCRNRTTLHEQLAKIGEAVPFQLQQEVAKDSVFINVQYCVRDGILMRSLVTEQIMQRVSHQGNRYPTQYDPWEHTDPLAHYLCKHGMQGVFAFDLAVDTQGGYFMLECNPRYNGSSYPTAIARKLGIPCWSAKSFTTTAHSLAELPLDTLAYDQQRRCGIILVNWGAVQIGALGVLLAGTAEEQLALEMELTGILS